MSKRWLARGQFMARLPAEGRPLRRHWDGTKTPFTAPWDGPELPQSNLTLPDPATARQL